MEYKSTLKKEIDEKIKNFHSYSEDIKSLIEKLSLKLEGSESTELSNEKRKEVIRNLLDNGILNKFFSNKNVNNNFQEIIKIIEKEINKCCGELIKSDTNKFQSVIWLRDNEKPAETYSFYNSGNAIASLYAKVGLNQRSYKLWSNGNRDGDYVEVYYNHLKNIQHHSFFPHNDKRFSHITSNYLSSNSEAREYLLKREEVWKSLYNINVSVNKYLIEKMFAFGYIIGDIDEKNKIYLKIAVDKNVLSLKLICDVELEKDEFRQILNKYGTFNVKNGITLNIKFGNSFKIIEDSSDDDIDVGVNAFYKLKASIDDSKELISGELRKHNSLITSTFSDDILFQIFIDILIYKIDYKIDSFTNQVEMEGLQNLISPKITKLNKEVDRLKKSEIDLNKEALIVNRMNAQLVEWHKLIDFKLSDLKSADNEDDTLNTRDL